VGHSEGTTNPCTTLSPIISVIPGTANQQGPALTIILFPLPLHARLQWFDQAVSSAIAGGITQVVLVAAGYDTRAYRLAPIPTGAAEPPVTFYEVCWQPCRAAVGVPRLACSTRCRCH
jgi:hypothetical protein